MNAPVAAHELQAMQRPVSDEFLQALATRFGTQCSTALAVREQHGRDEARLQRPPAAVVFAESTQDARRRQAVRPVQCARDCLWRRLIAEGHLLAVQGGIT
ncbi:hypothetical protein J4714_14055, partial [Staphylococcus epidermidis]|nr:hypothetical protein [Staphylococcus epidermidis]